MTIKDPKIIQYILNFLIYQYDGTVEKTVKSNYLFIDKKGKSYDQANKEETQKRSREKIFQKLKNENKKL